jgi:hypothetical protein
MAAPEMTKGAKTTERTRLRPLSFWSSRRASAKPSAIDSMTVAIVKTAVLKKTVLVSSRPNHST